MTNSTDTNATAQTLKFDTLTEAGIRLGKFETRSGERRIYINGTTREKIYFTRSDDGKLVCNSDALRPQPNTSSLFRRRTKDRAAFDIVLEALRADNESVTFDLLWEAL